MVLFHKSPAVCSEEHVFVFDEHLHHLSLVPDVIEGCDGVHVWGPHEGGSKDDGEVLRIHQVEFFIFRHPAVRDRSNFLNKQMNLQSNYHLHNRSKRPGWNHFPRGWWQRSPLQVRHEVLQGFPVWWRQQSQRFSESFELLLRICEFWMDTDRIASVRTQCDDATGNISNEPFHSNKFQPETVHFVLIHVTYSQPRWTSGKRRMRWWERANPSGRVWARP